MKQVNWKGYDISYCQPRVDWDKVRADFVILRAGYGKYSRQKDTMFESDYKEAKKRGIPVGAYWYSYAMSEAEARMEAEACAEVLKGKQFEMPIYYDVEEEKQFKLGKTQVSKIIAAFLEALEAKGYWVGLYGSYSSLTTFTTEAIRSRYAIWLAHWGVKKSPYNGAYGMWQYGIEKNNAAFHGDVDADYCYLDYPTEIKKRGLNGFAPQPTPPEPQFEPIKKGDRGEQVEEMQAMLHSRGYLRKEEIDGAFGKITLGALLAFQFENGLPVDGVCDKDDWEKLNSGLLG